MFDEKNVRENVSGKEFIDCQYKHCNAICGQEPRYLSYSALSAYVGLSVSTLKHRKSEGNLEFPAIKIGRKVLFDRVDVDRVLAAKKVVMVKYENDLTGQFSARGRRSNV